MPDADPGDPADAPSYRDAAAELESILADLERSDLDVDELATKVARAATLIELCRKRVGRARLEVERIVADLTPPPDNPA